MVTAAVTRGDLKKPLLATDWSALLSLGPAMQPLALTLKGFRGIRDGLGRDEITLDLERLANGAQLVAIAGANGRGKTTLMDSTQRGNSVC